MNKNFYKTSGGGRKEYRHTKEIEAPNPISSLNKETKQ